MAGSKSEAPLVILYDMVEDKATWAVKSYARRTEEAFPNTYQVIWEDDPSYEAIAKLAGPKPVLMVEEVSQSEQGKDNG